MSNLENSIRSLKGIGEKRAKLFKKLNISTLDDLMHYYPRGYEDFSHPAPIKDCVIGELCLICATVLSHAKPALIRRGMTLYKLRVADDTGECTLTYFNNQYIVHLLEPGQTYVFSGRMSGSLFKREMTSPEFIKESLSSGLHPVYPATEGLSSRAIGEAVRQALEFCDGMTETLPDSLRADYTLCHIEYAIKNIHQPKSEQEYQTASRRLVFEELLALQLGMLLLKSRGRQTLSTPCAPSPDFSLFYKLLPFEPTGAQKRAILEAAGDMAREVSMSRLLEGDVGSGKTVVAAALCWYAAQNGLQSALMAPTEILAQQHFKTLTALLQPAGVNVGLLTGSQSAASKKLMIQKLVSGELDVAVGTHALVQQGVAFHHLSLVITDEQHRFGVQQRARLASKGQSPHALIMSATPIPRTLALMIYGDLDISVLDVLPAGRQTIKTYFVDSSKRARIYAFIKQHLDKGFQAYIVCPLVENGDESLAAAEDYAAKIAAVDFAAYRVGLMHGRLKPAQKEEIMRLFSVGDLDLLVSTTVIEVGIDVPNSVVMVVENAERFGLSQLHQLRGRVGRGSAQSYCILISDAKNQETAKRLKIMTENNDGFKIAEQDLALRGPGDFFGHRQHGLPELRIADIIDDMSVLGEARVAAQRLIGQDPSLESPENAGLRDRAAALFSNEEVIFN